MYEITDELTKEGKHVNDSMVYSQTYNFYVHSTYVHWTTVQIDFEKRT